MSDVSGIPNMGFGGGNFFAPQFSYNPQMSAGQASAAYMPAENYAQNVTNNLYGGGANEGFGRQTDYYSALGASYSRTSGSSNPFGVFSDTGGPAGGGGGGASPYQTSNNVFETGASPFQGGGGSSGMGGSIYSGGGGYSGGSYGSFGGDSFGGSRADPYPNMSMPGGLGMPASSPSSAQPLDWGGLFGGSGGYTSGIPPDTTGGREFSGGSPMSMPQQQQPGINWNNVGAAAGSSMPYTSGIEPDQTGGQTFAGGTAASDPFPGMAMPGGLDRPMTTPESGASFGERFDALGGSAPAGPRTYDFKPMFEGGGGGGFGTGGTDSQTFGAPAAGSLGGNIFDYTVGPAAPNVAEGTSSADKSASAIAAEARARLADIIGSPETAKAVEKTDEAVPLPRGRPAEAPAAAPALSDLSNLPPEFPNFTKLYPEYGNRYGDAAAPDQASPLPPDQEQPYPQFLRPRPRSDSDQNPPRPPGDIPEFPAARLAPNGKEPELFVVHHTGPASSPEAVVNDWRNGSRRDQGIGTQYIMDRNGVIHDTANEYGYTGTNHAIQFNIPGTGVSGDQGTSNRSIVGMEIIAKDERDVTPAQRAALVQFANERYPNVPFYGHGEISGNRMNEEGIPGAQAVLASRPAPFNFDWSNAPIPGPENARPEPAPTSSYGPLATQDAPAEAVPLPTARPAAANIAQANSVLDSRIIDLVQKNSPSDAGRIPSSIANQTLREALGNTMTGGAIRSGLTPYLPQMGVSQAEFDKAYNSGASRAAPVSRFFGDDEEIANRQFAPGELSANWNKNIYEATDRPTMARSESLGADPNPFKDFRPSENFEDRRFDPALTDEQRQALGALVPRGQYLPEPGAKIPEGGKLGEALGTQQLGNLEANATMRGAAQGARLPRAGDFDTAGADVFGPRSSAFDFDPISFSERPTTSMANFQSPANDYNTFQQQPFIPPWQASIPAGRNGPEVVDAVKALAARLHTDPAEIAAMIQAETHDSPSALWNPQITPNRYGYRGLTQMGTDTFNDAARMGTSIGNFPTIEDYQRGTAEQQIDAYGDWLDLYTQQQPQGAAALVNNGALEGLPPGVAAAIMQGAQFAPNATSWVNELQQGNMGIPTTATDQAPELRSKSINDMTDAAVTRMSKWPQQRLWSDYNMPPRPGGY